MTQSWAGALDSFAAHLERQRQALEAGRPDAVQPYCPPPGLGPLPEALHQQALALLAQSRRLEAEVEAERRAVAAELQQARRHRQVTPTPRPPAFVDQHA